MTGFDIGTELYFFAQREANLLIQLKRNTNLNYVGNEEMRKDLGELTEDLFVILDRFKKFESRYKWNKASIVERLTGTAVGGLGEELNALYRRLNEFEHQFQD